MSDSPKYTPPKKSVGDHAHTLARAGLGAIPFVGAAASELLSLVIVPPLEKRRRKWMEAVAEGLQALQEKGVSMESLQSNDTFIDTILKASQAAIRNNQQEKVEALRNAVLNAALPNPPEESLQQMFLGFVDSFTVWHLRILRLFADPRKWYTENERHPKEFAFSASLSEVLEDAYPELQEKRFFYDQVVRELHERGLFGTNTLHTMMTGHGAYERRSTDLGEQFMKFIMRPNMGPVKEAVSESGIT